jgi:hypothetical protein
LIIAEFKNEKELAFIFYSSSSVCFFASFERRVGGGASRTLNFSYGSSVYLWCLLDYGTDLSESPFSHYKIETEAPASQDELYEQTV